MSPRSLPDQLLDLAADRALVGLGAGDALELERLLEQHGDAEALELELAAAELDLALARPSAEPLPEGVRAAIQQAGEAWVRALPSAPRAAGPAPAPLEPEAPRATVLPMAGWVLAAAAVVLAVLGWLPRGLAPQPSPADHARLYASLLERPDVVNPGWEAMPLGEGAGGDVAWSQSGQEGYLHIKGLAPNDPRVEQYQLWIFDGDQKHPVDGGVFDVRGDEEWVPIEAKLQVTTPTAFAVTVEKPGGVVVSDQDRVVLLAKL
jgi:anti-sigma-K factor RskA